MIVEIVLGIVSAIGLILSGKKLYPHKMELVWQQGLVTAALIYVVFALVAHNIEWMQIEIIGVLLYACFAWLAYKQSVIFLAIGWGLHVFWDLYLHPKGHPGFVPDWYPNACLGFDLVIAAYFIWYYFEKRKTNTKKY